MEQIETGKTVQVPCFECGDMVDMWSHMVRHGQKKTLCPGCRIGRYHAGSDSTITSFEAHHINEESKGS